MEQPLTTAEVTVAAPPKSGAIAMGDRGVELRTLDDAFRFAQYIVKSGLAPKSIDTPEKALIAIQYGAELGFSPMRSLSVITVVNGKPGIYGEAALAKISETGVCSYPPVMRHEGTGDDRRAVIKFQRRSMPEPVEVSFSVADAKKAKLWTKAGPWSDYPDDMLGWRAAARMCKRYFGDVTLGLPIAEELRDYPQQEVRPAPPQPSVPDPLLSQAPVTTPPVDVVEAEVVASEPPPQPDIDAEERAAATAALISTFRTLNTITSVERAWKSAADLRKQLDTETADRLTLAYESRLSELQAK